MYILDYLVYGLPTARQQRHVAVDSVELDDRQLAQEPPRQITHTHHIPPYVSLYKPPSHKLPLSQSAEAAPVSSEPASEPSQLASPLPQQQPQSNVETSREASGRSPTPRPPTSERDNHTALYVTPPLAPAPTPLGLKDCRSRACAGVVDTFQKALRKGAVGGHSSATDGSASTAMASAVATTTILSTIPAANQTGTPQSSTTTSTTATSSTHAPGPTPSDSSTAAAHQDETSSSGSGRIDRCGTAAADAAATGGSGNAGGAVECPPDTWQIGRATWTFLHSVAAHYPDHPTPRQQELMRGLMDGLVEFYPCEVCAEHLREQVRDNPPRVATARDLNLWLCGIHNEVNEMLGKPLFDCTRVAERWRDGPPDGSCD